MTTAHILVVDDEPDIRGLLKEILEDEGFEVTIAENAARAEEARVAIEAFTAAQTAAGDASESLASQLRNISDEIKIKTGLETADEQAVRKKTDALYAGVDALEASFEAENAASREVLDATRIEYANLEAKILLGKATKEEAEIGRAHV